MVGRVQASGLCQSPNRPAHGFVGHSDKAQRHLLNGQYTPISRGFQVVINLLLQFDELALGDLMIQGLVLLRPKDLGEILGQNTTQYKIGVCDCQGTALLIAGGTWMRARRLRTDHENSRTEE